MSKDFIPARESALFMRLFSGYTRWLFKRRFKQIWIHQEYEPRSDDRTVYFLNHTSWWDGLIPLLLNERFFHQKARAIMEYPQMKTYPFFKWLGAFSIQPDDPIHTKKSLTYAVDSMSRPGRALYLYPEGEIKAARQEINFKPGIGWLVRQLPKVDFVPVGVHMHTIRHDKPELHLWVGQAASIKPSTEREEITQVLQVSMQQLLVRLRETAGFDDEPYRAL